ncbi:MAG: elongation factor 1-beta [Candidatus Woesearchaeota archaeon]|nr:MAG: elongation factor 1-beta [Candidatus Woesearchaeota archaeon]
MAEVLIKIKVMPEDAETNIKKLLESCDKKAAEQGATIAQHEIQPVAFGLNALMLIVISEESKGITSLEEALESIPEVSTIEVQDVRRAIG